MPQPRILISAFCAATLGLASAATAGGHGGNPAVDGRQGLMAVISLNMGILGNMARERADYDADAALAAATNLAAIGQMDHSVFWPEGTDNVAIENTRALPAIWDDIDAVLAIWDDFGTATAALAETAGTGLDPMRAGLGPVGATCGACHDDYRAPR